MGSLEKEPDVKVTKSAACLYVIATPIGNLADMSPRARQILAEADLILCEDTRQLRKLLVAFDIKAKAWQAYHDHNEQELAEVIIQRMRDESLQVALVSDGGTPCISDPGYRITSLAHQHAIRVCPIPGPSAVTALISASGLPSDHFYFQGFLPRKAGDLQKAIEKWRILDCVIIFYETGNRLAESLLLIQKLYPQARLTIGRELSKLHEEITMLDISEARTYAENPNKQRGEFAIALSINDQTNSLDLKHIENDIKTDLQQGLSTRDIVGRYQDLGYPKKQLYDLVLRLKAPPTAGD